LARAKKQAPSPKEKVASKATKSVKPSREIIEDEDPGEDLPEDEIGDVVEELIEDATAEAETEEVEDEDTVAAGGSDEEEVDGFVEVAGDDDAPDLDEVLSKEDGVRNLAIRREIERRLEERRLAKDLDDLLLDD
jgi:hypothetical protein